ncbi:hypothetical protein [Burkholderia sp. WSM2230]|uniref:hypothetical protein n=1 Tax=Burkholderia sp. WSM2230 TaxID=944435 RepID=UPI0004095F6E|nr:hypothetical protein [Burkholderia sp. WSM2230]
MPKSALHLYPPNLQPNCAGQGLALALRMLAWLHIARAFTKRLTLALLNSIDGKPARKHHSVNEIAW